MYSRRITPDAVNSLMTEQRVNELVTADRVNSLVNSVRVNELLNPDVVNNTVTPQRVNELVSSDRVNSLVNSVRVNELLNPDVVNNTVTPQRVNELVDLSGCLTGERAVSVYSGQASALSLSDLPVGLYFYRAVRTDTGVVYHGTFHNSYMTGNFDAGDSVRFEYVANKDAGWNKLYIVANDGYYIAQLARLG